MVNHVALAWPFADSEVDPDRRRALAACPGLYWRLNINLRAIGKQHSLLATRHQSSDKHAIALRPDTRQPLTHSAKPRASKFQYPACIPALQTTLTRTQADANGDQDGFVFGRGHRLRCSYGLVVLAQYAAQVAFNLPLNLETAVDR